MPSAITILLAVAIDRVFGDAAFLSRVFPHPVALIARYYAWGEEGFVRWQGAGDNPARKKILVLALFLASLIALAVLVEALLVYFLPGLVIPLVIAFIASSFFSMGTLMAQAQKVEVPLLFDDIEKAASALSDFHGDDLYGGNLGDAGKRVLINDAIAALARHFSVGVVAPIIFFAIFGLPGLLFYTGVTIASVKGDGREAKTAALNVANRLHGLLLWFPERLTALLFLIAALADGRKWVRAGLRLWRRKPGPEPAAKSYIRVVAGILDIQLKTAALEHKAESQSWVVGDGRRDLLVADLTNAMQLVERAWTIMLFSVFIMVFLASFVFDGIFV